MHNEYNKIIIQDWALDASIGVYDFEKASRQNLIIDIEISFLNGVSFNTDDIASTLNYEEIISCVKTCMTSRHYQILENLAETLCHEVLKISGTECMTLKIRKPAVLGKEKAGILGIELKRYKDA
jgi:7,8-dihydroneopterin aldolase/epimerase/oxygenase